MTPLFSLFELNVDRFDSFLSLLLEMSEFFLMGVIVEITIEFFVSKFSVVAIYDMIVSLLESFTTT